MHAIIESVCNDGAVRLTNGYFSNNGFAEVCIEGEWIGICKSSTSIASPISLRICNQLGYQRKNVLDSSYTYITINVSDTNIMTILVIQMYLYCSMYP